MWKSIKQGASLVVDGVKTVLSASCNKTVIGCAVAGTVLGMANSGFCDGSPIVLPLADVLTNVETLVGDAIVAMGGLVVICLGGQAGFAILKAFGAWIKKAIG